jgi:hypothetical protein
MRCYNHPEFEAVGICASCKRGLCKDCAVEVSQRLACRNRCETDVLELLQGTKPSIDITDTPLGASIRGAYSRPFSARAIFVITVGVIFIAWGLVASPPSYFTALLGLVLVVYGVFQIVRAWRIQSIHIIPDDSEPNHLNH